MENHDRGLRKGTWSREEDNLLKKCIEKYGEGKWHLVPIRAGLNRCRKGCRLRWLNYLTPNINRSRFTKDEVDLMIRMHKLLGNKWSLIAGRLPGRTANDVKNFWNTHIERKSAAWTRRGGQRRENPHKTITRNNIVRPRPRILKTLIRKTNELPNASSTGQDKPEGEKPNNSQDKEALFVSTSEEVDKCFQWWRNLLETVENGELPNPLFDYGHDSVQNNDVDAWGVQMCDYEVHGMFRSL